MGCGVSKFDRMIAEVEHMVDQDLLRGKNPEEKQQFKQVFDPLIKKMFPPSLKDTMNSFDDIQYSQMMGMMKDQLKAQFEMQNQLMSVKA